MDKVYVLSKSAWHAKMLKWMWNLDPEDFSWMCPYFWICVLSVIVFVPYLFFRYLILPVLAGIEKLTTITRTSIRRVASVREVKRWENRLNRMRHDTDYYEKIYKNAWMYSDFIYWLHYKDEQMYYALTTGRTWEVRVKTKNERIVQLASIGKWVGMITVAAILILLLTLAVIALSKSATLHGFLTFLAVVAICVGAVMIIWGIVGLFRNQKFLYYAGMPFRAIGNGIVFVWNILMSMCPPVKWE